MMNENTDRRALLAIALSMAVYFVWSAFFAPPPPITNPPADAVVEGTDGGSAPASGGDGASAPVAATPAPAPPPETDIPPHEEPLSTEMWTGVVRSETGGFGEIALADFSKSRTVTPLWEWGLGKITGKSEGGWEPYVGGDTAYGILEGGALAIAGAGDLTDPGAMRVTKAGRGLQAQRVQADGLVVTTTWTPADEPHTLDVTVQFDNRGSRSVSDLWVGVAQPMSGEAGRFLNAVRSLAHVDGDVEHVDDLSDLEGPERETFQGPVSWFGVGDKYFMAVLQPGDGATASSVVVDTLPGGRTGAFLVDSQSLDAGASRTLAFQAYIGPKSLDVLSEMGNDLEDAVEFGWFGLFSRALLFVLKLFQSFVGNWGLSIILLTLLVKLLFFPLTQRAFTSSRKMQAIQPQLNALREKYKDNQQLQSQETMKLFQEHGVNPLGGCLPTLIQLPVWFALYNTMLYSVELYDTQFLYIQDLTAADPYGVIPTIYAALMFGQQRMMPMGSMDEAQQKVLKAMPLIFAFFMFSFPSGLVLYFCVNMSLTIVQQWWIKRSVKDVPVAA